MNEPANESPRWKPGLTEGAFFLGIVLLILGFCITPERSSVVVQTLDFRNWRVSTWLAIGASIVFAVYWRIVWRLYEEDSFDDDDLICHRRFLLATSLLLVETWGWALLAATPFPRFAWFQLGSFLSRGVCSAETLGTLLGATFLLVVNVVVILRWLIAVLNRSVQ